MNGAFYLARLGWAFASGYCIGYWIDHEVIHAGEGSVIDKAKKGASKAFARCAGLASKVRFTPRTDESDTAEEEVQVDTTPFGVVLTCPDCDYKFYGRSDMCLSDVCAANRVAA